MCGIFGKKCGIYKISKKICTFLRKKFGDMKKKYYLCSRVCKESCWSYGSYGRLRKLS